MLWLALAYSVSAVLSDDVVAQTDIVRLLTDESAAEELTLSDLTRRTETQLAAIHAQFETVLSSLTAVQRRHERRIADMEKSQHMHQVELAAALREAYAPIRTWLLPFLSMCALLLLTTIGGCTAHSRLRSKWSDAR